MWECRQRQLRYGWQGGAEKAGERAFRSYRQVGEDSETISVGRNDCVALAILQEVRPGGVNVCRQSGHFLKELGQVHKMLGQ